MANVLWITTDDVSYTLLQRRCEALGVAHAPATPNLNTAQDTGINYTRFYGQSVCSPFRACSILGRYAFRTGLGNNAQLGFPGAPAVNDSWLCQGIPLVPSATFGKWHLYTSEHTVDSARDAGQFWVHKGLALGNVVGNDTYWHWDRYENGVLKDTAGLNSKQGLADGVNNRNAANYLSHIVVQDALDWIAIQPSRWFCWVQMQAPHRPIHFPPTAAERASAGISPNQYMSVAHEALLTNYSIYLGITPGDPVAAKAAIIAEGWDPDSESALAGFIGMVETIDYEIGRLLAAVDTSRTGDTTVMIFSDNGENDPVVQPPLDPDHAKGSQYELSIRLPLIIKGPDIPLLNYGKDCRSLVHAVDLWRTTLRLFGVNIGNMFPGVTSDSKNIASTFTDLEATPRTSLYCENFLTKQQVSDAGGGGPKGGIKDAATGETNDPNFGPIAQWERTMVDDNWKLITRMPTGPASVIGDITYELYNTRSDYLEEYNMIREPNRFPQGVEDVSGSEAAWLAVLRLKALEDDLLPYPT